MLINFISSTGRKPEELMSWRLRDKVHIFNLVLLKLAQVVCIVVRTNPIENEENPSNQTLWEKK